MKQNLHSLQSPDLAMVRLCGCAVDTCRSSGVAIRVVGPGIYIPSAISILGCAPYDEGLPPGFMAIWPPEQYLLGRRTKSEVFLRRSCIEEVDRTLIAGSGGIHHDGIPERVRPAPEK